MHSVTRMLMRLTTTTATTTSPLLLPFAAAAAPSSMTLNPAMVRQLHTTDVDFRARQVGYVAVVTIPHVPIYKPPARRCFVFMYLDYTAQTIIYSRGRQAVKKVWLGYKLGYKLS